MQHLLRHFIFIGIVIALSIFAIIPPSTTLKLAKDLNGGATLVYQVEIKPSDPQDTLANVVQLIKKRLDPDGVLEISVGSMGESRIEITMPLPNEAIQAKRRAFETELSKLDSLATLGPRLESALQLKGEERTQELKNVKDAAGTRAEIVQTAIDAFMKFEAVKGPYEDAERAVDGIEAQLAATTAPEAKAAIQATLNEAIKARDPLAVEHASSEMAFRQAMGKLNASAVTKEMMRRALEKSNKSRKGAADPVTGKREELASPQTRELNNLRARYPEAKDAIDALQKQWDIYQAGRSTLDDPSDIKRLMRGAGILTFRIAVRSDGTLADEARLRQELRTSGPRGVRSSDVRWFKINKLEDWFKTSAEELSLQQDPASYFTRRYNFVGDRGPDGEIYMLLYDVPGRRLTTAEGNWSLASSRPTQDEIGRPAISFNMDAIGAIEMRKLTGGNTGFSMAVLLDDIIYTAPNINSAIGSSGIIQGEFTATEINYIVRTLSAGSMAAKLSPDPISESTVGPELGKDNLDRGLKAGVISFVVICGFMIAYYFSGGVVSTVALAINLLLLLALMVFAQAAFSLPGIAGIILAFGMAVDANVLIYERLREELEKGEDLRTAVRMAYSRATAPILDGNVTHLITCVLLGFFGTPEIRGFAITMSIGVVTTLFCQLYITHVIYSWLVDKVKIRSVKMLPLVFPAVQRAMHLKVDWMRLCPVFFTISGVLVIASVFAVVGRGNDLLDTVFRGGTRVTVKLKDEAPGKPTLFTREQVVSRINPPEKADSPNRNVLGDAQILVINPDAQNRSNTFIVQTTITVQELVKDTITTAFRNELDINEKLVFTGSRIENADAAPIYPIVVPTLGDNFKRPELGYIVSEFIGGAAILMEDLQPATDASSTGGASVRPSLASLEDRLRKMQRDPRFSDTRSRAHKIICIKGTDQAVESAVVLVRDDTISFLKDSDRRRWIAELKPLEWKLAAEALSQTATLAGVENFSPSIAQAFVAQAITAIVLSTMGIIGWVWLRFLSVRYSLAAIIATLHDCIVTLGAIAVAEWLYNTETTKPFAAMLGILPFKIDLNVIAAVLTILGYSLNDKIVVMDRIRENRGKLPYATRGLINDSINQTISRTIMTGTTVLIASLVLYVIGGEALRAFAFCFIVGVISGTYSSIAVAAPIVWSRKLDPTAGGIAPSDGTSAVATT